MGLAVMRAKAQAEAPTITSIGQFWARNSEEKAKPSPFRIECDVTYYDPFWDILFIRDNNGEGTFIRSSDALGRPFEFGQHLVVTGEFQPPGDSVRFDHAIIRTTGHSLPTPRPVTEGLDNTNLYLNTFVSIEGIVDHYSRMDANHLGITLSTGGTSLLITLLQILVQGPRHITVMRRLEDDDRFRIPVVPIASLPRQVAGRLAHVKGQVKVQQSGRFLRIRDSSGEVDVLSGQTRLFDADEWVEAVGYPQVTGTEMQLAGGIYKTAGNSPAAQAAGTAQDDTVRVSAHVLDLEQREAAKGRPVQLSGVVTWGDGNGPFFFLQDSTGGVMVMKGGLDLADNHPGRNMEVTGVTGMGDYVPVVIASKCKVLGDIAMPTAQSVTLEHAYTGTVEDSWVEMSGYLRQVRTQGDMNFLEMVTASGEFTAILPVDQDVAPLVGGTIRVQGVCTAQTDGKGKLTGIELWVPSRDYLIVDEAPQKTPFGLPARPLSRLGRHNTEPSFNRRMRFSGVVLHQSVGHSLLIEDGGQSLRVYSQSMEPLAPGDRVDVVGILAWQGSKVSLHDAIYRKSGHGEQPKPLEPAGKDELSADYDGHLVTIEASLIDSSVTSGQLRLTLQREKTVFEAYLSLSGKKGAVEPYAPGSTLSLTGAYEAIFDELGRPSSFRINLRGPGDISLLSRPPWLTRQRILALSGALAVAILLFIAWVVALSRQVNRQTEQIREQGMQESRLQAELQRANKLEALGLLAGGIAHDFNNLLTAIIGNISLVLYDRSIAPESAESLRDAEKAADRAKNLTLQLLTFAKGGTPIQVAVLLPDVIREVAEFALHGSGVHCRFNVQEGLWPANVDKGQIGQVVQNIVINAMQAMPKGGTIDVSIRNEEIGEKNDRFLAPGRYLRLSFADHGQGIRPENLDRIFDPYFTTKKNGVGLGLATVHSIVKKHLGHISVESELGKGTTFSLWLPAAPSAAAGDGPRGLEVSAKDKLGASRILLMDDEVSIRRLGTTILSRLGYEVSVVNRGEDAVREYAQSLKSGRPYAAVILDLTIPGGMGGLQAMEELRKIDPNVRAIVSSGYSNDTVLSEYRAYGFRGIVAKPYAAEDLAKAVEQVLWDKRA